MTASNKTEELGVKETDGKRISPQRSPILIKKQESPRTVSLYNN